MAHPAMPRRALGALGRIFRPLIPTRPAVPHRARRALFGNSNPAPAQTARQAAPLWVRGLTAGGRPVVLAVALLMCAPGEYHLARTAGWSPQFAYGMPVVLSAYAGIAAAVASTRRRGDRGLVSAVAGACLALTLAMAAQVVSHLIDTGHLTASQPWLIAITSLVPPAVVGHLLHLAATPPNTPQETPEDDQDGNDRPPPPPVLLSTAEVARWYSVDPSTVRGWSAAGRLTVHTKDARGRNWYDQDALPSEPAAAVAP
jgi:hypothetical protein